MAAVKHGLFFSIVLQIDERLCESGEDLQDHGQTARHVLPPAQKGQQVNIALT